MGHPRERPLTQRTYRPGRVRLLLCPRLDRLPQQLLPLPAHLRLQVPRFSCALSTNRSTSSSNATAKLAAVTHSRRAHAPLVSAFTAASTHFRLMPPFYHAIQETEMRPYLRC